MTAIDDFLAYAANDRERSAHTVARYRATLASVEPFGDPATIGQGGIEEWWQSRIVTDAVDPETGERVRRSPASRANELFCLRAFYKWATRFGHRTDDPTRRLDPPKTPNHVPRPIGEQDLRKAMTEIDDPEMRRAIALGAYAGLRVSEVAALDWSQIDQEARRMYVRGKGQKERVVGVSPVLLDKILPATGGNVVTSGGGVYTPAVLQRKVNRQLARHGIEHTFHDLRKRGATLALAKGHNPVAVKQMFGWTSLETALSYAAVGDEELDAIAADMV